MTHSSRQTSTAADQPDGPPGRSIDPIDYQRVPRAIAGMAKGFPDGFDTGEHVHERDQMLFAIAGVMRIRTDSEAWIVPPDRAVYVPSGLRHRVVMRGRVEMRTLYVDPKAARPVGFGDAPIALEVSPLLRELVLAFLGEPLLYDDPGRGGRIAALMLDEISRCPRPRLVIPMPADKRLLRLCERLLDDPARSMSLDDWSAISGAAPRTLTRLFVAETGLTFTAWRQRVRFHNAFDALSRGVPVAEVAAASGYRSASAFTAAFQREFGRPPSRLLHHVSRGGPAVRRD